MVTAPRSADTRRMARRARRVLARTLARPRPFVAFLAAVTAALCPLLPGGPAAASARRGRAAHTWSGYSLSFDGTGAYVRSADSPSLHIEKANAFTVTFWT